MFDVTKQKTKADIPQELLDVVTEKYRSQIQVPNNKPLHQFLLCPVGLVGAGKTTVIKPLSKKLDLVRVSTDEIRIILKQKGYNYSGVRDISYKVAKYFLDQGYSVAIDANCGTDETRRYIEEIAKKYQLPTIWLRVNPPDDFVVHKLQNFKHTWLFENGNEAVKAYFEYKKHHGDYAKSDIPFTYTFDTSKSDLPEQIKIAEKLIREKLKI